jgi:hypothetical protein
MPLKDFWSTYRRLIACGLSSVAACVLWGAIDVWQWHHTPPVHKDYCSGEGACCQITYRPGDHYHIHALSQTSLKCTVSRPWWIRLFMDEDAPIVYYNGNTDPDFHPVEPPPQT